MQVGVVAKQLGQVLFGDDTITDPVSEVRLCKIFWSKCIPMASSYIWHRQLGSKQTYCAWEL